MRGLNNMALTQKMKTFCELLCYNDSVQIGLAAEKRNHYPPVAYRHVMNNPANEGL